MSLVLVRQFRGIGCRCRWNSRMNSTKSSQWPSPKEFRVLLDNETLYVDKDLAMALGWKPDGPGASLTLNGVGQSYFTITPTGSDSDRLSSSTVESMQNSNVQKILAYMKDR